MPTLPRLDIAPPASMAFRLRWALAGSDRRRDEVLRLLWEETAWEIGQGRQQSLAKIRFLVDKGVWTAAPGEEDALAHRLRLKADAGNRGNLAWDALRAIQDGVPAQVLHMLLEAGVDVDFRGKTDYADTLLTAAMRKGRDEHVEVLLRAGADLGAVDSCHRNALRLAVKLVAENTSDTYYQEKGLRLLDMLLAAGADPNAIKKYGAPLVSPDPHTPLTDAACCGWLAGMDCLMQAGARADHVSPETGHAVLHVVANNFQPRRFGEGGNFHELRFSAVLERLLQAGAQVNVMDRSGNTPFLQAVRTGEMEVAVVLLENGADPSFKGPTQPPVSHLLVKAAAHDDPCLARFFPHMPPGWWMEKDQQGLTAHDVLFQQFHEGELKGHEEPWLAIAGAEALAGTTPPAPAPSRRMRL